MTAQEKLLHSLESGHRFDGCRQWAASLDLAFGRRQGQNRLLSLRHRGPLRVQRPFYPEGRNGCCHVYLLHPPGGLVSGDALTIRAAVEENAHTLLTTPAAGKLYKADSCGVNWSQDTHLRVAPGGALEYLPQEIIAFDGSRGRQCTTIALEDNARCLGWEVLALGRPAGNLPFVRGRLEQRFNLVRNGVTLWNERQVIDPDHARFRGMWGQGGATVQATLWAAGLADPQIAVEHLRRHLPRKENWAATQRLGIVLVRYLGKERNRAWDLCQRAWELLRPLMLGMPASPPRIWST